MDEKGAQELGRAAEEMAQATRRSYKAAVDWAFELQKGNIKLSRTFFETWLETLEKGTELNRRVLRGATDVAQEQQRVVWGLPRESLDAYEGFLDSLSSYPEGISEENEDPGR